jgi:hypothetical protein
MSFYPICPHFSVIIHNAYSTEDTNECSEAQFWDFDMQRVCVLNENDATL